MGYFIDMTGGEFVIPDNETTLAHMKTMVQKYKRIQRGGSYGPNGQRESWFSWVMDSEILDAKSVEQIFNAVGFETEKRGGEFELTGYSNKTGQEELFLAHIAEAVMDGSYVEFRGEDLAVWKYVVENGKLKSANGYTVTQWDRVRPLTTHYLHSEGTYGQSDYLMLSIDIDPYGDIDAQIEEAIAKHKKEATNA